jgi:CubicO group peptidase (beta-lactamase class C family)
VRWRGPQPHRLVIGTLMLAVVGACAVIRPDRAVRVASAFISQTLCSATFVSGLDAERVYATTLRPMGHLDLLDAVLHFDVDTAGGAVTTSVAGLFRSRAIHREGAGCVLIHGEPPPPIRMEPRPLAAPIPAHAVETSNERIRSVLDRAFSRGDLATTAVVVMHGDSVIAERYAPGYGVTTRLQGWSLKKSVVNALVGTLVGQGRLAVHGRAPVPAWDRDGDARRGITIDHLLRMTSGLALTETNSGFDPVSRMLFLERDPAAFAERAALEAVPGGQWRYSTGNTAILARLIRDVVGGRAEDVARFAREALFDPLGMSTALIEFDATGAPMAMYASARDWARFGRLFATDGVVNGRRILPEGWVTYSTSPTLQSGYGAGWWLGGPTWRPDWSLPADAFYAAGHLHQKILVIPSARLVIARFGVTHVGDDGFGVLAEEVLAAIQPKNPGLNARPR